jgi:hypothetical protein
MPRSAAEWVLLLLSVLAPFLLVGIAELGVRAFSDVDLLGNSRHLFVANGFGTSKGNTPNVEAVSFGETIYTDEYGFRVPKGGVPGDAAKAQAVLLLGDSIGFGPAVEESDTFAGLLRARIPDKRIYNSSVIGYATPDYRNVVEVFVPAHPEVTAVVLLYSLNDVTSYSAQAIDRYLGDPKPEVPEQRLTEALRGFTLLSDANDFLRSRSKLYLLLRHHLLGTQVRDWRAVLNLYSEERSADIERAAGDVAQISAFLRQRAIPLVVVVCPFEYQLRRPDDPETQVPQRRLGDLFSKADVAYVDARPSFDPAVSSRDYFLAYDAAHLSEAGHRVIADVIGQALAR